jgi:hypothetical protein
VWLVRGEDRRGAALPEVTGRMPAPSTASVGSNQKVTTRRIRWPPVDLTHCDRRGICGRLGVGSFDSIRHPRSRSIVPDETLGTLAGALPRTVLASTRSSIATGRAVGPMRRLPRHESARLSNCGVHTRRRGALLGRFLPRLAAGIHRDAGGLFIRRSIYSRVTSFPLFLRGLGAERMVGDPSRGEPVELV